MATEKEIKHYRLDGAQRERKSYRNRLNLLKKNGIKFIAIEEELKHINSRMSRYRKKAGGL